MNNLDKQYTDLLGDAYKNYGQITNEFQLENPIDDLLIKTLRGELILFESDGDTDYRTLTKKEFINKIKTVDEFAKKWGVKVEIRELSLEERVRLTINTAEYRNYTEEQWKEYIDTASVPKRVISLTYNNETIESYE